MSEPQISVFYLAVFFIFLGSFLLWIAGRKRRAAGLPGGRIIYADTRLWGKVEKPFFDRQHMLTGKPDYLVEQSGVLIPVEVKSMPMSGSPYDSHIYQLAAYCLLVEKTFGKRPPYGILHYRNCTFAIDFTAELEAALLSIMQEMRKRELQVEVNRSHASVERCARCGFLEVCDQSLKESI
jgi:CRISPR-associated exonuclease Cas4